MEATGASGISPGPGDQDRGARDTGAGDTGDAELLARHVAGDPEAFGILVQRHRDRLWAVALRTLGDREEAADALQDALVSAFRAAHTYQGRSAVTTWLHRIVVNACLDRARRAGTRRTRPLDDTAPGAVEAAAGASEGADVSAERGEVRREVAAALAGLPAEQRAALVLVDLQGYPVAEAAEVLGVPVGTVKSRCARARAKLLPLLAHLRGQADPVPVAPAAAPEDPSTAVSRETAIPPGAPPTARPRNPRPDSSVPTPRQKGGEPA